MIIFRWLLGHVAKLKAMYAFAIVILSVSGILQLYTFVVQRNIIDDVLVDGQYEKLWLYLVMFAVCFLGYIFLEVYGPYVFVKNRSRIERNMSFELLNYLYKYIPIPRLHRERTAKFTSMLTIDVMHLANMLAREVPITLQLTTKLIMLLGFIAWTSPTLLLVLLVICGLYVLLAILSTPKVKKASREAINERNRLHVLLDENISGIRELVSYNRGSSEDRRYHSIFVDYFRKLFREGMLMINQTLIGEALRWTAIAIILVYCGLAILREEMSLGTFVFVFQFSLQLLVTVQTTYAAYLLFAQQIIQADRLLEAMDEEVKPGHKRFTEPVKQITFHYVDFCYSEETKQVLQGTTMHIPAGQKIAFVGESGCGKSTLLQLLAQFYEPQAGEIRVNGHRLTDLKREDWAARMTLVMQEAYFFEGTIRENLLLGSEAYDDAALMELCKLICIDTYIAGLAEGFDTVIGERGVTLSGGERQRLALVRALVRNTEILILDEATSALDYETERRVQAAIDTTREGMTTIIIAHRLSTIRNADQIFVFREGHVIGAGTDAELLGNCTYYRSLVEKQIA